MKNILVPTDFSACATNALDTGVAIAKLFNAKLHVLTNLDLPKRWKDWDSADRAKYPELLQKIENTKILQHHFKDQQNDKIAVSTTISHGNLIENINRYLNLHGIDMVVMGSHGASGKNEFFLGSNTQKVVRTIHCPTLVVKDKVDTLRFDKVIFASGFDQRDKEALQYFVDWVKPFLPEIHLVTVHTASIFDLPYVLTKEIMEEFKSICHPLPCYTHIHRDFTRERGIRSFAEEIGAQLIGLSNHYRHPLKRMLRGSTVEAVVNHAGIPVLSIDYEKEPETAHTPFFNQKVIA